MTTMTNNETNLEVFELNGEPQRPSLADQIHDATQAVRTEKRYITTNRSMTAENIRKVAELFECKESAVRGSKKFLNTKHPFVAPVYRCLRDADALVKRFSFDYPDRGVRLMRRDRVQELVTKYNALKDELRESVQDMHDNWEVIVAEREADLGPRGLFNRADYNIDVRRAFSIELSFPVIQPDRRMERLAPAVYEAERRRIAERMEGAVLAAEQEAAEKLSEMLGHLVDRLQPEADGSTKTLYSSALTNIRDCCQWFSSATLRTNEDLDNLVQEIEALSTSVSTKDLKRSKRNRDRFSERVAEFKTKIDSVVVKRPKRSIQLRD